MQTISFIASKIKRQTPVNPIERISQENFAPGIVEKWLINLAIKANIFIITISRLHNPKKIWSILSAMFELSRKSWGGNMHKLYKVDGKYYYNIYSPGWPSKAYSDVIVRELHRYTSPHLTTNKPSFIFLAITKKCPLRCEHCFEWDNLNQKESFTKSDLLKTVEFYQQQQVMQIHFSGGEPMVRIKDLLEVIRFASAKSECWVLTSGFNMTQKNAVLLKRAGCKGVVVSIDHYIPEMHNLFRGQETSFTNAIAAVHNAKQNGLVTAISICVTRQFLNGGHLLPFIEFAKGLGVHFIQILEPRSVGHYHGKDVSLDQNHITTVETIFKKINLEEAYRNYPTILYHGYHQRRVGCFAGSRSLYIDSIGDVHACPFCHSMSYNIIDLIRQGAHALPQRESHCPKFEKLA